MSATLEMYVVYERPRDYPDKFVVRRWGCRAEGAVPEDWFVLGTTLDEVRAAIPRHCVRLERDPRDEPQIIEVWI
jgi:hypothetical protein